MVEHFYSSDSEVSRDSELQDWINEIFIHGFLGNKKSGTLLMKYQSIKPRKLDCCDVLYYLSFSSTDVASTGIPKRFNKVKEVVKFITMIIFTVSAQHSALNMGQVS